MLLILYTYIHIRTHLYEYVYSTYLQSAFIQQKHIMVSDEYTRFWRTVAREFWSWFLFVYCTCVGYLSAKSCFTLNVWGFMLVVTNTNITTWQTVCHGQKTAPKQDMGQWKNCYRTKWFVYYYSTYMYAFLVGSCTFRPMVFSYKNWTHELNHICV